MLMSAARVTWHLCLAIEDDIDVPQIVLRIEKKATDIRQPFGTAGSASAGGAKAAFAAQRAWLPTDDLQASSRLIPGINQGEQDPW